MIDLDEQTALLEKHEGFIAQNANHWLRMNPELAFDDLMQMGRLALLDAHSRFDPKHGNKLLCYALPFIRRAMRRHAVEFAMPVRQSEAKFRRRGKYMIELSRVALDAPIHEDSSRTLLDMLATPQSEANFSDQPDLMVLVEKAMRKLKPQQIAVLKARYIDGLKLREVGKAYGLGRERIRQIEAKALRLLRESRTLKYA